MPYIPDFHEMGCATGYDEQSKTDKNPVKLQVFASAHKIDQGDRNGVIGNSDEAVRNDMQPDERPISHITGTMRHELFRRKELFERIHGQL